MKSKLAIEDTAWTPGPYRVIFEDNGRARIIGARRSVAFMVIVDEEDKATARLIAAAPDLYAALNELVTIDDGQNLQVATCGSLLVVALDKARAALIKALST